jgi:hypothetical protein
MLDTFLHIHLTESLDDIDIYEGPKKEKKISNKQKRKGKNEKQLERDLKLAEAEQNKEQRVKQVCIVLP